MWEFKPEWIHNQGGTNKCTIESMTEVCELLYLKKTGKYKRFSSSFISAFRECQNDTFPGMGIWEVLWVVTKYGICEYGLLPQNIDFPEILQYTKGREKELLENAAQYKLIKDGFYVETTDEIKAALNNSPMIVGTWIFSSFHNLNEYNYEVKKIGNEIGPHAVTLRAHYKDDKFWCINHAGKYFGYNGQFVMDRNYWEQFPTSRVMAFVPTFNEADLGTYANPENLEDFILRTGGGTFKVMERDDGAKDGKLYNVFKHGTPDQYITAEWAPRR